MRSRVKNRAGDYSLFRRLSLPRAAALVLIHSPLLLPLTSRPSIRAIYPVTCFNITNMTSSMKAYLAAKYMSGPKADAILARSADPTKKKKKRKAGATAGGSGSAMIKDDDVLDWGAALKEERDEEEDVVVASDRGFKKRQRTDGASGWATLREPTPPPAADEQPQVVVEEGEPEFTGGLLTSSQLKKKLPRKVAENQDLSKEEIVQAQETVYRDATGRKVDMAVERAEAAKRKREAEEREARKMQWGKGLVQREDEDKKKKELESMKNVPFARTVDDTSLNEEQKAQDRWNDPAAAFLSVR